MGVHLELTKTSEVPWVLPQCPGQPTGGVAEDAACGDNSHGLEGSKQDISMHQAEPRLSLLLMSAALRAQAMVLLNPVLLVLLKTPHQQAVRLTLMPESRAA